MLLYMLKAVKINSELDCTVSSAEMLYSKALKWTKEEIHSNAKTKAEGMVQAKTKKTG